MNIVFNIHYLTNENQQLYVVGSIPELGAWRTEEAKAMTCEGAGVWKLSIETSPQEISYQYFIIENNLSTPEPWVRGHSVKLNSSHPICYLFDFWQPIPPDIALYSSAFTKNLFAPPNRPQCPNSPNSPHIPQSPPPPLSLRTLCPRLTPSQKLHISGNHPSLGNWNPELSREMHCINFPEWEIQLNIEEISFPLEYKFLIFDNTTQNYLWETGENRSLSGLPTDANASFIISTYPFRDPRPAWKGAGTVIPVFSLRSEQSFGIGDLNDLKLLIDWAKQTNQCLIQLLPLNDTTTTHTWSDSYPYNAISTHALHPIYISLKDMGDLKDAGQASLFQKKQKVLNAHKEVYYENVLKNKIRYCKAYFNQEKEQILNSEAFRKFCRDNRIWLQPYAAFCYFRDKYRTADFTKWGIYADYQPLWVQKTVDEKNKTTWPKISFIYFLQFVLHTQFKAVSDYAREKGVILKGDLPIGISRTSVEAWTEREYFNSEQQTGAPPDFFSATGQNWSFPTYNWETMENDGYSWWKRRFQKLYDYFDCIRIDHILGFFRIWEIPVDYVQGLCGHFRPALPLTVEEIEAYGFVFDSRYIRPRIHRRFLKELFGETWEEISQIYLARDEEDGYFMGLKPICNTQHKIEQVLKDSTDENAHIIKKRLFMIANEVLFVEDPYQKNTYHPRILAPLSYAFQGLTQPQQIAYQQLSHDFFYVRHNDFWKSVALKRLTPLVNHTDMLICGEDLGMIPQSVKEVMDELHILSLELERTPKSVGVDFTDLQSVPYLSVCTTSTHDMEPLRNWWRQSIPNTQNYYNSVLGRVGEAPTDCTSELAEQIIRNHLNASSILTIIPLQDWFAMDDCLKRDDIESERINIPENPKHYWRYRMHISLEQLLQAKAFNHKIREMIEKSGC